MIDDNYLFLIVATAVAVLLGAIFLFKSKRAPTVLPLDDFQPFKLVRKEVLSHDTARFTFGLPTGHVLGLPTGQHISLRFFEQDKDTGKSTQVMRSYTPVTDNNTVGEVSLVIKVYRAGVHPKFPDGGKMSQHLDSLKIGDTIDIKGPKGHMEYLGNGGNFWVKPIGKPTGLSIYHDCWKDRNHTHASSSELHVSKSWKRTQRQGNIAVCQSK